MTRYCGRCGMIISQSDDRCPECYYDLEKAETERYRRVQQNRNKKNTNPVLELCPKCGRWKDKGQEHIC